MTKIITIQTCANCPHKDHRGAYGQVAYIPVCRQTNKNLGYTKEVSSRGNGIHAQYDGKIPSFCPLEDYPNAK